MGGAVELAPGYLKQVYDIVRKSGGVCIADEVQSGFGRTGSHYWGFQTQDVIPDIVTMAKVRSLHAHAKHLVLEMPISPLIVADHAYRKDRT